MSCKRVSNRWPSGGIVELDYEVDVALVRTEVAVDCGSEDVETLDMVASAEVSDLWGAVGYQRDYFSSLGLFTYWLIIGRFFEYCGCPFKQGGQVVLNEVPDLALFVWGIIGFKHFAPTENASVVAYPSRGRVVVDDKSRQRATDFIDLPFDGGFKDPISGVVV